MQLPHLPERFTFGDFIRMFIGWLLYLKTSVSMYAKSESNIDYLGEGVHASISVCVAITILLVSYIIRGILEDKESWLHIVIHKIIEKGKFKRKTK